VAPVAFNRAVLADRGGHHGRRPFALSAGAAESIETGEPVSRKRKSTDASYWLLATAPETGRQKVENDMQKAEKGGKDGRTYGLSH